IVPVHVFEPARIWNGREQVHVELVEQVRGDCDAPGLGDGGDLAQLGKAAPHRVRLQDGRAGPGEEGPQIVAGEVAFAADDAGFQRRSDPLVTFEIFADDRLFQPVDV